MEFMQLFSKSFSRDPFFSIACSSDFHWWFCRRHSADQENFKLVTFDFSLWSHIYYWPCEFVLNSNIFDRIQRFKIGSLTTNVIFQFQSRWLAIRTPFLFVTLIDLLYCQLLQQIHHWIHRHPRHPQHPVQRDWGSAEQKALQYWLCQYAQAVQNSAISLPVVPASVLRLPVEPVRLSSGTVNIQLHIWHPLAPAFPRLLKRTTMLVSQKTFLGTSEIFHFVSGTFFCVL